jgi:Xaa-Pro aminopeptidase
MAAADLVAIVAPAHSGHSTDFQAISRYLSHCGGGPDADITVVFPIEGDVTVGATSAKPRWPPVQDWVTDIREARRDYGKVVIARLRELDVAGKRVGITGLGYGARTPEGTILYSTMQRLQREFPTTTFVNATRLVNDVREVKSAEEIDFLTKSAQLTDLAFESMRSTVRPGVKDYEVWAEAMATMLRNGGEPTMHFHWASGPAPSRTLTRASHRELAAGDIIINELEANWAGYRSQGVQPVAVQHCHPDYLELMKLQNAAFDEVIQRLRPGVTVGELATFVEEDLLKLRPSSGVAATASIKLVMHGRGLGEDTPIITPTSRYGHDLATELRENVVCILKPEVRREDGGFPTAWGDTVVVTPNGGRRLGTRSQGIWAV